MRTGPLNFRPLDKPEDGLNAERDGAYDMTVDDSGGD